MRSWRWGLLGLVMGCGASALVASGVLGKDESCGYTANERYASAPRTYDFQAAAAQGDDCEGWYYAQLLVSNDNSDTPPSSRTRSCGS